MEKLIHSADGSLKPDDPYIEVGSVFERTSPTYGNKYAVLVTTVSAQRTKAKRALRKNNEYVYYAKSNGEVAYSHKEHLKYLGTKEDFDHLLSLSQRRAAEL